MIWIQHDFYSNFVNSVGSGDTELTLSIFTSEVTDLVVHDTANLLSMFEKAGVKIRKKASDEEIVDAILDNIQTNNKFVRGLSYLMYEWNGVKELHKQNEAQALSTIGKISACIRKVAKEIKEPSVRRSLKKDIMAMDALKVGVDGVRSGIDGAEKPRDIYKKDNTVLYLMLGVAVAFGAYYLHKYFKAQKEAKLLAAGGAVSTAAATPSVVDSNAAVQATAAVPAAQTPVTPAQPAVAAPVKTNHPMPSPDVFVVAAPVVAAAPTTQIMQPAVAQSSVNVNAVPNA